MKYGNGSFYGYYFVKKLNKRTICSYFRYLEGLQEILSHLCDQCVPNEANTAFTLIQENTEFYCNLSPTREGKEETFIRTTAIFSV